MKERYLSTVLEKTMLSFQLGVRFYHKRKNAEYTTTRF